MSAPPPAPPAPPFDPPAAPPSPTVPGPGPDDATSPLTPPHFSVPGHDRLLPPPAPGTHRTPTPDPSHFAPSPSLGGPLVVTSAGSTTVATDGMRAAIGRAATLAAGLGHGVTALHRAEQVPHAPSMAYVEHALRGAISTADELHSGLTRAVASYSAADHAVGGLFDGLAGVEGAMVGAGLRMVAMTAGPALLVGGAVNAAEFAGFAALLGRTTGKKADLAAALAAYLKKHPQLTSNPRFVTFVRGITGGLDEAMLSAAGVPPVLAIALGATGRTGVSTSAGALMALGPHAGLLEESPVEVRRVDRQAVATPPMGAAQRLDRVPEGDQVRIERYRAPGAADRFVVYVGPTETFDPRPEGQPWDMASNVGGVGGEDVASIRATELAMRDAGIHPGSEVQLVGFSQGGMVASRIAADGNWNAVGLQTFGAPAGNVALPDGIQGMAVRNREDFIPALAGPQVDHHLLQVQRTVYADPATMPTDQAAPGHQRVAYAATAQAIDAARSDDVRVQSQALDDFAGDYASRSGSTITAYTYHATRQDGTG